MQCITFTFCECVLFTIRSINTIISKYALSYMSEMRIDKSTFALLALFNH